MPGIRDDSQGLLPVTVLINGKGTIRNVIQLLLVCDFQSDNRNHFREIKLTLHSLHLKSFEYSAENVIDSVPSTLEVTFVQH